ncbi:calcium-binding protein [Nodosilinea sp. LEGE 06152]|uniref:EF-hand domain-containing protein n=1 Tax=Nodosilinea sp. LEGE 06152 TaxID=2777966 RepID=UPI001880D3BF|nr:EF-hand domain-containing protein [Nodosilinea sp. LEGE 06152]MBE9157188.1 calcium-binding protein [Nodosilinea sp. LEGE 06152]
MLTDLQQRKLTKLFSMYDSDYTGVLVKKDFELMFKKLSTLRNWSLRSPRCLVLQDKLMRKWQGLEKKADTAHNHQVSRAEWLAYYEDGLSDTELHAEDIISLMDLIFDVFDQDEDGKVNQEEWGQLLAAFNESPVYAPLVFPPLDTDQDGWLTKAEFLEHFSAFCCSDDADNPANGMFGPY